ncbi:MAG: class I SAM-dependent RNA methyltransferase [Spirochaetaceae bacterium]|nr:class I SAM-dependent RNA methyltransferase [Myxococcales bacterium]MCB9726514.1 class I SAM-dependent RNA methyltransferase [Spirochaetaceae bacterium]HPG26948.1 TRAM domain-containing protein [Myxococcota bacterium]
MSGSTGQSGIEVRVEALAAGGDGIARLPDGRVVFVEGGLPGDLVELDALEIRPRLARARIARLIEASPDRVEPECAHFGRCGGCQWQHLDYEAQVEAKRRIVQDALERIGGIAIEAPIGIVPSPAPYHYRARARLVEADSGVGYRRRGSHEVEAISKCPILVEALEAPLAALRAQTSRGGDEIDGGSEVPDAALAGDKAIDASGRGRRRRRRPTEWCLLAGSSGEAVARPATGRASKRGERSRVEIAVAGERLRASVTSFVQGNALLWDALADAVAACALAPRDGRSPGRFVELYAGIGFLTVPLARRGLEGVAVESDRSALGDLEANLRRSRLGGRVEVVRGRAELLRDLGERIARADVLLVDPPRVGLHEAVRRAIEEQGPGRCVYLSCDPATLARDLRALIAADYRLVSVRAFDLFPQTPHVETLAVLERG